MPHELALLTADALRALPRDKTVFFFPVGPLEDHGPGLPMGMNLVEATGLCRRAAERLEKELPGWQGVIMPTAPLGVNADTSEAAIKVRAFVLRDWLVDACRSLGRLDFVHFVCFSGQLGPRQLTAIEDAGKIVYRSGFLKHLFRRVTRQATPRAALVSASSALVPIEEVKRSPFWPDPVEHGARRDLSLALALAPEQVAPHALNLPAIPRAGTHATRAVDRLRGQIRGYWGNPAGASAEVGEATLRGTLDEVFPKLRATWEGANPNAIFRTWYSILPPNKSFLVAWILVAGFLLLMLFWLALFSQTLRIE